MFTFLYYCGVVTLLICVCSVAGGFASVLISIINALRQRWINRKSAHKPET